MFKTKIRGFNPAFGKNPTTAEKIVHTAQQRGLSGMSAMQGGPNNIFDTVLYTGSTTNRISYSFFTNVQNKSQNFTNWQGQFSAGQSLAATTLNIMPMVLTGTNLSSDGITIDSVHPPGTEEWATMVAFGTATLIVGGSTVFEDLQLIELYPTANPANTGLAVSAILGGAFYTVGRSYVELPTIPVITPNIKVEFQITLPPNQLATPAGAALMVTLGRQGSTFAARGTW